MLGNEGFGRLGIIQSSVGMFATVAGFGLGLTATKHVAEFRVSDPKRAGRVIGLSSIVSLGTGGLITSILVACAPWLAARTLNAPELSGLLILSAPLLLLGAWGGAQAGALAGFEAFKRLAQVNVVAGLLNFPLMVGGVYLGGIVGAVWGLLLANLMGCGLNSWALRVEMRNAGVPVTFAGCRVELPIVWKFSLPSTLGGVMVGPVTWACNAFLVNRPSGYAEMGLFNAANQWRIAIAFVPSTLSGILLPVLANLHSSRDVSSFRAALKWNLAVTFGLSLATAIAVCAGSSLIMASYGPAFRGGEVVLILLSLSTVLWVTCEVIGQAIASSASMWWGLWLNGIWAIAMVASSWFLVGYGAAGLALAVCIAYLVHLVTVSLYARVALFRPEAEGGPTA
jgi:O-antigen/teichoic acid export membrane protein